MALPVTDKALEFANALIHTALWLSLMGNGVFRTIGHGKLMGKKDFSEIERVEIIKNGSHSVNLLYRTVILSRRQLGVTMRTSLKEKKNEKVRVGKILVNQQLLQSDIKKGSY